MRRFAGVPASAPTRDPGPGAAGVLGALEARASEVALAGLLTAALAAGLTAVSPPLYRGVVKVAVLQPAPAVQTEDSPPRPGPRANHVQNQLEVLTSLPLFAEVARQLGLTASDLVAPHPLVAGWDALVGDLSGRPPSAPDSTSAGRRLRELTQVHRVDGADVLRLEVRAGSAALAARLANALAEAFATRSLELVRARARQRRSYLTGKLALARQDLAEAEAALRRFQEERDTVDLARRLDHLLDLRIEREAEKVDIQRQISELTARLPALRAEMERARDRSGEEDPGTYIELQRRLLALRVRKASLAEVYTARHPEVIRLGEEVTSLERQVAAAGTELLEGRSATSGREDAAVATYNALLEEIQALRARDESLRTLLAHHQTQLDHYLSLQGEDAALRREVEGRRRVHDLLVERERHATLEEDLLVSGVRVLEPATPEPAPVAPRPSHAALLWGALGVALGALAALWRSAFDDRVRDQEALEREVGVPCLGELPRVHAAPRAPPLEGPVLEAATQLSLDRSLRRRGDEGHVVLVTSAGPGEGKTTLAAHLALAFAASGEPTVLLDLDLRRPGIHVVLSDLGGALHLETLLSTLDADGPAGLPRVLPAADALDGLVVVLAPSRYDPDLLSSGRPAVLLEALRARGYRVVVDSPPTVPVPDAPRLSAAADEVLVVVRADHARLRAVRHTLRSLQAAGASLAGMVLNDAAGEHGVYASVGDYPAYRAPERGAEGG